MLVYKNISPGLDTIEPWAVDESPHRLIGPWCSLIWHRHDHQLALTQCIIYSKLQVVTWHSMNIHTWNNYVSSASVPHGWFGIQSKMQCTDSSSSYTMFAVISSLLDGIKTTNESQRGWWDCAREDRSQFKQNYTAKTINAMKTWRIMHLTAYTWSAAQGRVDMMYERWHKRLERVLCRVWHHSKKLELVPSH